MITYIIMRETGFGKDGLSVGSPVSASNNLETIEKRIQEIIDAKAPGDHTFYYYECVPNLDS